MIALEGLVGGLIALRAIDKHAIGVTQSDRDGTLRFEGALPDLAREGLSSQIAVDFLTGCVRLASESWPGLWRLMAPAERTRLVSLSVVKLVMSADDWEVFDERAGVLQYEGGHDREYAEVVALAELSRRAHADGLQQAIHLRRTNACSCGSERTSPSGSAGQDPALPVTEALDPADRNERVPF